MAVITIIPAYNEEKSIAKVVKSSLKYSEVMVIDDGSEDKTFEMAKNAGAIIIQHSKNLGKGAALKAGLHFALDKKYDEAEKLSDFLISLSENTVGRFAVPGVKFGMTYRGFFGGQPRLPLLELKPEYQKQIIEYFKSHGITRFK